VYFRLALKAGTPCLRAVLTYEVIAAKSLSPFMVRKHPETLSFTLNMRTSTIIKLSPEG
jgi:hypothetical protein